MKQFIKKLLLRKICVLGDSHASVFTYINSQYVSNAWFDVTSVGGATAFGLANPNSKTNALKVFNKKLLSVNKNTPIVFLLGEVDTGYLIWWRSDKNNSDPKDEFRLSLNNYTNFILDIKKKEFTNIYVLSSTLPTIKNNFKDFGEIAGERNKVKASQTERTEMALEYNRELRHICDDNGLTYIDLDDKMLDQSTQFIKDKFLNTNPLDHHCDSFQYSNLIIQKFRQHSLIKWIISKPLFLRD